MVQSTFIGYESEENGMKKIIKQAILFYEGLIWEKFTFLKNRKIKFPLPKFKLVFNFRDTSKRVII